MSKTKEEKVMPRLQQLDEKATEGASDGIGGSISVVTRKEVKDPNLLSNAEESKQKCEA